MIKKKICNLTLSGKGFENATKGMATPERPGASLAFQETSQSIGGDSL